MAKETPLCPIHRRKLVCPRCEAIARGRRGGRKRAANAQINQYVNAAGRLGGRHPRIPASLKTPLSDEP